MTRELITGNGYVFIDHNGEYVRVFSAVGFSNKPSFNIVKNLSEATVFQLEHPWMGCSADHLKPLKNMQCLKARVDRVVKLAAWREESRESERRPGSDQFG